MPQSNGFEIIVLQNADLDSSNRTFNLFIYLFFYFKSSFHTELLIYEKIQRCGTKMTISSISIYYKEGQGEIVWSTQTSVSP